MDPLGGREENLPLLEGNGEFGVGVWRGSVGLSGVQGKEGRPLRSSISGAFIITWAWNENEVEYYRIVSTVRKSKDTSESFGTTLSRLCHFRTSSRRTFNPTW